MRGEKNQGCWKSSRVIQFGLLNTFALDRSRELPAYSQGNRWPSSDARRLESAPPTWSRRALPKKLRCVHEASTWKHSVVLTPNPSRTT